MYLVGFDIVVGPSEPTRQVVSSNGVRPVRLRAVQFVLSHVVQGRGGVGRGGVDRNIGAVMGGIGGYPCHGSNFVWKGGSGLRTCTHVSLRCPCRLRYYGRGVKQRVVWTVPGRWTSRQFATARWRDCPWTHWRTR